MARAAAKTSSLQILSTVSTTSVEDVTRERGAPVWFQLYATNDWRITKAMLQRAERAGCPVVALTVDQLGGRNTETFKRLSKTDTRDCSVCHDWSSNQTRVRRKPMFDGLDVSQARFSRGMTWDYLRRLKDATSMRLFIKGIVTAEDAELCVEHGVDGLIVSNHGGRVEASGRSTIECLEEIVNVVKDQMPVLIDSGFRRGTDVFKALALGADAVCIGRPYLWGLASFGQEGVHRNRSAACRTDDGDATSGNYVDRPDLWELHPPRRLTSQQIAAGCLPGLFRARFRVRTGYERSHFQWQTLRVLRFGRSIAMRGLMPSTPRIQANEKRII